MISITIKVVGSNCSNGIKLLKSLKKINVNDKIKIETLNDEKNIKKYNIKNFPGLVINDTVASEGKVLTTREINKLINAY